MDTIQKGKIFVISGPSGVGKGTLLKMLLKKYSELSFSVSATTRNPRPGEKHGVNYFFITKDEFQNLISNDGLLEWAEFAGNYYGTPVAPIKKGLEYGKNIVLEIEVQGAMQVKNKLPEAVLIFIAPPSLEELEARLIGRNTESREIIGKRLSIVKSELEKSKEFDHIITNDNLNDALCRLEKVVSAEVKANDTVK